MQLPDGEPKVGVQLKVVAKADALRAADGARHAATHARPVVVDDDLCAVPNQQLIARVRTKFDHVVVDDDLVSSADANTGAHERVTLLWLRAVAPACAAPI